MRRQAGFTLFEVVAAVLLLTGVVLSTGWVTLSARNASLLLVGQAEDVRWIRHALATVERDLRRSTGVETSGEGAVFQGPTCQVRYEVVDGVLWRSGDGPRAVVARRLAAFEVTFEGTLARISVRPQGRREPGVPGPAVVSVVHLRAGGSR